MLCTRVRGDVAIQVENRNGFQDRESRSIRGLPICTKLDTLAIVVEVLQFFRRFHDSTLNAKNVDLMFFDLQGDAELCCKGLEHLQIQAQRAIHLYTLRSAHTIE